MLTDRHRQIVSLLLAGSERVGVRSKLGISAEMLSAHLSEMRRRLGVDSHDAMMAALRQRTRNPADAMLDECRARPRQWYHV